MEVVSHRRQVFCCELCAWGWRGIRGVRDAVIFELYHVYGMTPKAIADLYSITRQAVNAALARQ